MLTLSHKQPTYNIHITLMEYHIIQFVSLHISMYIMNTVLKYLSTNVDKLYIEITIHFSKRNRYG